MNSKANLFVSQKRWDTSKFEIDEYINITRPTLIGYYSVDESQELVDNMSELKYMLKQPGSTYLDLTLRIEDATSKVVPTKHNPFFDYLYYHEDIVNKFERSVFKNVGFITSRGVLIQIGKIPYNNNSEEIFIAQLINGVIYLNKQMKPWNPTNEIGWGYKFRQYLLSSSTKCETNTNEPVNENPEFNGIFSFKLGNDNILCLSVIDGVKANCIDSRKDICKDLDERSNINELNSRKLVKLFASVKTENDPIFMRYKSLTFWLKCFYGRCEELYIGYKNRHGIVNEIKKYSLNDMEKMGKEFWSRSEVLSFTSEFLAFVKKCFMEKITDNCNIKSLPEIKLCFKYEAKRQKGRLPMSYIEVIDSPEADKYTWLPEWYTEEKKQKQLNIHNSTQTFNLSR